MFLTILSITNSVALKFWHFSTKVYFTDVQSKSPLWGICRINQICVWSDSYT